eukprot:2360269-Rhodomonas_salina.1
MEQLARADSAELALVVEHGVAAVAGGHGERAVDERRDRGEHVEQVAHRLAVCLPHKHRGFPHRCE